MLRSLTLYCFLLALFLASTAQAQVCSDDVLLYSQSEVDAFDCTEIDGNLEIGNYGSASDIINLLPLSALTSVSGYVYIADNHQLLSLYGLGNLASVGDDLVIVNNDALESLGELENLTSCGGGISISNNDALESLVGLEGLTSVNNFFFVVDNVALVSLSGIESLISVGGNLFIRNNDALQSINGLESVISVNGNLTIDRNGLLSSLEGLNNLASIGGNLNLAILPLESLSGLERLSTVSGDFIVYNNPSLASLSGLASIVSIDGDFTVYDNAGMESLSGLEENVAVGGNLTILNNDMLETLSGLESITSVDADLEIVGNASLQLCSCGLSGLISGDPPTFSGVDEDVVININDPEGSCTSPEVVLATPCEPVANENENTVPQELRLEVYPNPVARSATLSYALSEAGSVRLAVYDLLGREVSVLADAVQPMGHHQTQIGGLASGTYVVRMEVGDGEEMLTRRVTVVN